MADRIDHRAGSSIVDFSLSPNVAQMLGATAARAAGAPAVIERQGEVTYAELRDMAAGIAAELRRLGVKPGDRVVLFLHRGAPAAAAFFGVAAAGGVAVILNETLRPRQIEHVLSHCDARVLVHAAELFTALPRPPE